MAQQASGSKSRFILVNKYGFYFLLFSLYSFEQSVYGTLVDHETGNSDTSGNITYFLVQVTLSLGFLFFAVSRRILKTIPARRNLLIILSILYICGMLGIIFLNYSFLLIVCNFLSSFSMGYIGATVYYCMAEDLYQYSHLGIMMALGKTITIILQYILQEVLRLELPITLMLVIVFFLLIYLILHQKNQVMFDDLLPYTKETPEYHSSIRRKVFYAVILGLIFYINVVLNEITFFYAGTYFSSFPRLFMIIGLAYDFFGKRFIHIFGLCSMAVCFVSTYSPEYTTIRFCLFYFTIGAMTGYLNLSFWSLAPKTRHPDLWASFTWIINILETFAGLFLIQTIGEHTYLILLSIGILFIAAIEFSVADLLTQYQLDTAEREHNTPALSYLKKLAFFENNTIMAAESEEQNEKERNDHTTSNSSVSAISEQSSDILSEDTEILTPEQQSARKFLAFTERYHFTPRECDVLKELLTNDDTMKNISEQLGISERMLYRYMNNLYQKTGVETRAALMKLYYESSM